MKEDPFVGVYRALSPEELAQMFMNPNAPKTEAEHSEAERQRTVRSAARMRQPLDGADAQALEGALCSTERERDEARAEVERLRAEKDKLREEKEVLHVSVARIECAAAGAIYSQESIYVMASSALEALEAKP